MSEVCITFMGICLITLVEHIIVSNRLDELEQKINALKENEGGNK